MVSPYLPLLHIKTLRIPNALVAAVAILGITRLVMIGDLNVALYTISASAALLIVTFLLFWQGFVGCGDAKLITAAALLVGYHNLYSFLMLMGLCGGMVSLVVIATRYLNRSSGPPQKVRLAIPYGVAIAGGAIVTLLFQPSLFG